MDQPDRVICMYVCVGIVFHPLAPTDPLLVAQGATVDFRTHGRARVRARAHAGMAHGRAFGGTASRALEHQQGLPSSAPCPIPVRPPKIVDDLSEKY